MNVGEYIKNLRIEAGLSQEELGKQLGVQRAAVQKWECGRVQNLKRDIIKKLAIIFNVPPASFIDVDSIDPQMQFGEIIKNRRIELGLTMLDVAQQVGVSEGTISRWESGNIANMRRDKIAALAKTLQLSPSVIIEWSNNNYDSFITNNKALPDILYRYDELSGDKQQEVIAFMEFKLAQQEKQKKQERIQAIAEKVIKESEQRDLKEAVDRVSEKIAKGDFDPNNAKIAAYEGYIKAPKGEEAERAAKIKRLVQLIEEEQSGQENK